MNIFILHRVPYFKIEYHRGIDHDRHDVTYFGTAQALATIPGELRCIRVERPGLRSAFEEARSRLADHPHRVDRVISMSEYELLDAALLREHLGVPGIPVRQVTLSRDKVLMKRAVEAAGLRVPRFLPLTGFLDRHGVVSWSQATVLKPHRGASSVDVVVFPDAATAYRAVTACDSGVPDIDSGYADLSGYQVEEFVDGPILHFDGLVAGGRLLTVEASEYLGTCLDYARGRPLGSFQIGHSATTREWVERALAAVEIEDGSFHLEAIVHDGELVFLEVGNRVGGADVVATFELATGIHLPAWELRILLGEPVADRLPRPIEPRSWYGWFVHPGHHLAGQIFDGLDGADEHRAGANVVTWHELPPGTPLPDHVTYGAGETALAGIAVADSPEGVRQWMSNLFGALRIRTSAPTAAIAAA